MLAVIARYNPTHFWLPTLVHDGFYTYARTVDFCKIIDFSESVDNLLLIVK